MDMDRNEGFWAALDRLVEESEIVIDRRREQPTQSFRISFIRWITVI